MTDNQMYCRAQMPQQIIQVMEAMGYSKQMLFGEIGVDLDKVSPDELLSSDVLDNMWPVITKYVPEDEVSFRIMEYFSMAAFGVAGYVVVNSPNCLKAYENFIRYNSLSANHLRYELNTGNTFELTMILQKEFTPIDRFDIEMTLLGFITYTKSLSASRVLPQAVYMQYSKPKDISCYEAMLPGVPLYFGNEGFSRLVYDKKVGDAKVVGANPMLYQTFDNMAEEALKAHQNESTIAHQVRTELTRSLKSGMPTIDEVARKMNLSERTLQLKLKTENTSFREIADEVRRDIAIHHLKKGILNVSEIAYLLGFSEVSSFSSAFKKWTGATPSTYTISV